MTDKAGQTAVKASLPEKLIYWLSTAIMVLLLGFAIQMYLRNTTGVASLFESYSYPGYVVIPLALAKAGALVVILLNRWRNLKDIAYGAYFINMIMALYAHIAAGDAAIHAWVGAVAVPLSYILSNRVRGEPQREAFLLPPRG